MKIQMTLMSAVLAVMAVACGAPGDTNEQPTKDGGGGFITGVGGGGGGGPTGDAGAASDAGATGGGGGGSVVDAGPQTITVHGTVMTGRGVYLSSATIVIPGVGTTTTGGGGSFTIPNVLPPYDVIVMSGVSKSATIYKGLTRANPQLMTLDSTDTSGQSTAKLVFNFSGTMLSESATSSWYLSDRVELASGGPSSQLYQGAWVDSTGTALKHDFRWWGSGAVTASTSSLQVLYDKSSGLPLDYTFGHAEGVVLAPNAAIPVSVSMGQVTTAILNANIEVPAGGALTNESVYLQWHANKHDVYSHGPVTPSLSVKVPTVAGADLVVEVWGKDNAGNTLHALSQPLSTAGTSTITLPVAPRLSLPIDSASGIDPLAQTFSWVPVSKSPGTLVTFTTDNLTIYLVTFGSQARLPDLAGAGLGTIPTGTKVTWNTYTYDGSATMDELTNPARVIGADDEYLGVWQGGSTTRSFTAK